MLQVQPIRARKPNGERCPRAYTVPQKVGPEQIHKLPFVDSIPFRATVE